MPKSSVIRSSCAMALLLTACQPDALTAAARKIGDAQRGRVLTHDYGCGSCHQAGGVPQAIGLVGPPLDRMGRRTVIAGLLPNTPDNMVLWLKAPQAYAPGAVMPNMDMDDRDAHDIAAYLYTLR